MLYAKTSNSQYSPALFAVHALSVAQRLAVFSDGSLQSPHGVVGEERRVYVAAFKHFQSLPDGFHTCGGVARTERHGDAIVGIERTQFYQSVLCLIGAQGDFSVDVPALA